MIVIARALTPDRTALALDFMSCLKQRETIYIGNNHPAERITEARAVILIHTGEIVRGEDSAQAGLLGAVQRAAEEKKLWALIAPDVALPVTVPPERIFTSAKSLCTALFPTK